jgi:hypothetical protein
VGQPGKIKIDTTMDQSVTLTHKDPPEAQAWCARRLRPAKLLPCGAPLRPTRPTTELDGPVSTRMAPRRTQTCCPRCDAIEQQLMQSQDGNGPGSDVSLMGAGV